MKEATSSRLVEVAATTARYSGADLEGVVKAACSFAMGRCMDPNDWSVPPDEAKLEILFDDIVRAL
jgi:vesicle-fusing ATPase